MIFLEDRSILEISGSENKKFLQGLITNDINKASDQRLIYTAMLNPQGRFLYDFFIFEKDEKLFLDCSSKRCDEILQKLTFYKLRAQVEIKRNDEIKVVWNQEALGLLETTHHLTLGKADSADFENRNANVFKHTLSTGSGEISARHSPELEMVGSFLDPRSPKMGYRLYGNLQPAICDIQNYHLRRIQNKIPESEYDLTYEKSFILEFGFDNLNAISYDKGCYIGQEITARTHYKGEIRKKIFYIKINSKKAEKNSEITTCDKREAGTILSSIFYEDTLHALALIRLEYSGKELEFEDKKISIVN